MRDVGLGLAAEIPAIELKALLRSRAPASLVIEVSLGGFWDSGRDPNTTPLG
jgi:hypothetical protein